VLGKGGARIKEIGARARAELSRIMGVPVHLYLHVKVNPKWEEDRSLYREIGLDWVDSSTSSTQAGHQRPRRPHPALAEPRAAFRRIEVELERRAP
jgi:hypothetical protein